MRTTPHRFCRSQDLSSDHAWEVAAHVFARECCAAMGLAEESPLTVTVDCGTASMPTLIKMTGVLAAKGQSWQHLAQLPLEVDLPQRFAFHSVFACPVARDQSAPDNPPMILPCGCGHDCHAAFSVGHSTAFTYDTNPRIHLSTVFWACPVCPGLYFAGSPSRSWQGPVGGLSSALIVRYVRGWLHRRPPHVAEHQVAFTSD